MASNAIGARAHGIPLDTAPWGAHVATADSYAVPEVLLTDPEAASVGLTAMQAERLGHRIKTVDVNIGETVPGANFYADGYSGRARIVVDVERGFLLGASSSDRESPSSCTRPLSQSLRRCPSTGCGMPCRASRPSVKCGCVSWRPTATHLIQPSGPMNRSSAPGDKSPAAPSRKGVWTMTNSKRFRRRAMAAAGGAAVVAMAVLAGCGTSGNQAPSTTTRRQRPLRRRCRRRPRHHRRPRRRRRTLPDGRQPVLAAGDRAARATEPPGVHRNNKH